MGARWTARRLRLPTPTRGGALLGAMGCLSTAWLSRTLPRRGVARRGGEHGWRRPDGRNNALLSAHVRPLALLSCFWECTMLSTYIGCCERVLRDSPRLHHTRSLKLTSVWFPTF